MAKTPKVYTRLTRNAAGVATYSSLWLATDHLMLVSSTGFSESYARVMLRDIKAMFITQTDRRAWWNFAWAIPAGIAAIRIVADFAVAEQPVGSVVFLAVGVVGVLWNTWLGPGCRVYVVTGVQTAKVPALVRIKKARHVMARLQPLIAAAQADLIAATPETVAATGAPPADNTTASAALPSESTAAATELPPS